MTIMIMLLLFGVGYALITLEHKIGIDKSAIALMLGVLLWVALIMGATNIIPSLPESGFHTFMLNNPSLAEESVIDQVKHYIVEGSIITHVGDISEIILFLMGAMTIVELIDRHDGFNFVGSMVTTRNRVKLLWIMSGIAFILSAILDNMTSAIVMVMVLRKLVPTQRDRWLYASILILAANAGGVFSPIGDVTTIMLWVKGNITSLNTITDLFLPSVAAVVVPLTIVSFSMRGEMEALSVEQKENGASVVTPLEKNIIFWLGVGGLIFVPVFRGITDLPPFMGILFVLSILWVYTELIYNRKQNIEESVKNRASKVLKHIDMPTILFFFGILMAVAALEEAGILASLSEFLDKELHNVYLIDGLIGVLSSVVDNVPLVAGAMGMYSTDTVATTPYLQQFVVDGQFWQLLAYCAGVGGSILIIGSAAGVVVMGLEKISFGWYLRRISWLAFVGYLSGIGVYYLQTLFF